MSAPPAKGSGSSLSAFPLSIGFLAGSSRACSVTMRSPPGAELLGYGDPAGYPPLRRAIADYLRTVRAVDCDADQVLIVNGSQMGLVISALALTTPELCVCIEEPGYPGVRAGAGSRRSRNRGPGRSR